MRKSLLVLALLSGVAFVSLGASRAADEEKAKFTIKEVMKQAHGGGNNSLASKVAAGTATKEEKDKLVELYTALAKNKPTKGDAKSWKEKSDLVLKCAEGCAKGDTGAGQVALRVAWRF